MIQFQHVNKQFSNGSFALKGLNFCCNPGDMVFLTGHSGAGKTTVLKLITCQTRCTSGHITINGKNLAHITSRGITTFRRHIGMVFQNPYLLTDRNVFDNIALPLDVIGMAHHERPRRVRAALDKVGLLHKEKLWPEQLSTGEQQRIGIARAIVNKPAILLADEPTGNLDPSLSLDVMRIFQDFNRVGVTVLIASHDIHLIEQFNARILTLKKGQLIANGSTLRHTHV